MKTPRFRFAAAAVFAGLSVTIFAQEREPLAAEKRSGTHWRYNLEKYSGMRYFLKCNKQHYAPGEPVLVQYSIKNLNEEPVPVTLYELGLHRERFFWVAHQLLLQDPMYASATKTRYGKGRIFARPSTIDDKIRFNQRPEGLEVLDLGTAKQGSIQVISVSNEKECIGPTLELHQFFDLSFVGTYELHREQYIAYYAFEYDPPRKSNTVTFRIKNGPSFRSSDLKNPGMWIGVTDKEFERHDDLPPSGDYSKLKYVLLLNKGHYKEAEPVFLRLFLKNESDDAVNVRVGGDPCWTAQHWSLSDIKGNVMPKMKLGAIRFPDKPRDAADVDWVFDGPSFVKLEPGEEVEMDPGEIQLNLYYDVSQPGRYKLQCFRSTVTPGQKFDPPLESNEVQFEIVEGKYLTPDDLVEPGSFEEPPQ